MCIWGVGNDAKFQGLPLLGVQAAQCVRLDAKGSLRPGMGGMVTGEKPVTGFRIRVGEGFSTR